MGVDSKRTLRSYTLSLTIKINKEITWHLLLLLMLISRFVKKQSD